MVKNMDKLTHFMYLWCHHFVSYLVDGYFKIRWKKSPFAKILSCTDYQNPIRGKLWAICVQNFKAWLGKDEVIKPATPWKWSDQHFWVLHKLKKTQISTKQKLSDSADILTGVKLNNNWTQYSSPESFWQCNQDTEPELH